MATITVELPSVFSSVVDGALTFTLEADTLASALEQIRSAQPRLALHLFDESGGLRQHVLCFLNDTNSRWIDSDDAEVSSGDRLLFMQAVSGG